MDFTSSVLTFTPSLCVCKRNMHVRRLSGHIKQEWGTEEADRGTMANQLACNMEKPCDLVGQEDRNKAHWWRNDIWPHRGRFSEPSKDKSNIYFTTL